MTKPRNTNKGVKKKPIMTMKEKWLAKKSKKRSEGFEHSSVVGSFTLGAGDPNESQR